MTIKKAIGAIFSACNYNGSGQYTSDELNEAKKVLVAAARKRIPKKVRKSVCPSCNRNFLFGHGEKRKGDYCDNCGQALDWSDTE